MRDDFYAEQDAGPADVALLVEVADSSLAKDLDAKLKLYAAAGIQEYWVVETFPELKADRGPVAEALARADAGPAVLEAWRDLVAQDIEPEDDDAY